MRLKGSSIASSPNARILILDRFYYPDEQATSVYLTEITTALQIQFDFEILTGPPLVITKDAISLSPPTCRIFLVPCFQFPKRLLFARALNDLSFLFMAFVRGLFIQKPDILITQTSPPGIWWVGFLLSRWHRTRWIHICKDVFPDNLKVLSGKERHVLLDFLGWLDALILKRAHRILVIGEDMKERFLKKGFRSGQIVKTSDWVNLQFIRPIHKENSFTQKHKLAGKFVVLYAGNLGRVHNFEDILDAAEKLKNNSKIIFLLVGEGALKKWIDRQVQSRALTNVQNASFESRAKLPEVLASADVSVVLLRKGMAGLSVPSKIYSTLASGRPILACMDQESDIARMVQEAKAGFVIPPGKPEEFVQTVLNLFEKRELRAQLGANARQYVEKEDFQKRAFQDYARVMREVLEEK